MGSHASRIRVLLIDDHDDTREMYARYFASVGMDVQTAADGAAGVQQALLWHPHVIVMDWAMPVMTGDAATRALKQNPQTRSIPIAIVTAFGVGRRQELEALGADAVCAKPCNPAELVDVVRRLAAKSLPAGTAPKAKQTGRKRVHRPKRGTVRDLSLERGPGRSG